MYAYYISSDNWIDVKLDTKVLVTKQDAFSVKMCSTMVNLFNYRLGLMDTNLITLFNWTLIFDWYKARLIVTFYTLPRP